MYFLCTWCTRECCNQLGRTPFCRDSRVNDNVSQYISYAWKQNNTPKPWRPGVRCRTSALLWTSSTRCVQENASIGLVVLQSAEILGLMICFAIHSYAWQQNITPKPRRPGVSCMTSALVCTSCAHGVQENAAIGMVVLQSAEILGLIIICFEIHFLFVTIEYYPKQWRPGVSCTTSALVCTSESAAIGFVILQSADILGLIIICFAIHFLCVTIEYYP